jgi:hypothetical protein
VVFTLDRGPEGKETQSKINGELQYFYVVNSDANVIYLSALARQQLMRTGAQAGDSVEITKLVNGQSTNWKVQVLSDAAEPTTTQMSGPRVVSPRNGHNGYTNGATAVALQPEPVNAVHPFEERYARMFVVAAHALASAQRQLQAEGVDLEPFIWEDVRALGIHFAISAERKEERQ